MQNTIIPPGIVVVQPIPNVTSLQSLVGAVEMEGPADGIIDADGRFEIEGTADTESMSVIGVLSTRMTSMATHVCLLGRTTCTETGVD